jgi:ribosomal protein S18 acetylase RimI-like enzyme
VCYDQWGIDAWLAISSAYRKGNYWLPIPSGIAKALIKRSQMFGSEQAVLLGKSYVGSIAVDKDNVAAKNLYEKCGYVVIKEETMARGPSRTVLLMKYTPEAKGSA